MNEEYSQEASSQAKIKGPDIAANDIKLALRNNLWVKRQ